MTAVKSLGQPAPAVTHDENFPVASWLCPPALRPGVKAIYWFARTADDIADEGDADAASRLAALARYRADLRSVLQDPGAATRWPQVYAPLGQVLRQFQLASQLLFDLLDAFEQDVAMSRDRAWYGNRAHLLDYCRRSANPVGRLLLQLYGVSDAQRLQQSDNICSALQLINFWQDLGLDAARGRFYLPLDQCVLFGVSPEQIEQRQDNEDTARLIQAQVVWARQTMLAGAPLATSLPGRIGWELRLVVAGGLRILDKIEALRFQTLRQRPRLRAWDAAPMFWRALRM
jgi:squalene synthase HpnC